VDIIKKYDPWLASWSSGPDKGQSDAINRGFRIANGDIVSWLCSDDLLRPDALWKVAFEFMREPEMDVLAGACRLQYDCDGGRIHDSAVVGAEWESHPYSDGIWQPSCFFRRSAVAREFLVDENLHYCMDRELWCHFVQNERNWGRSDEVLSHYRYTGANKSVVGNDAIIEELVVLFNRHAPACVFLPEILRDIWMPLVLRGMQQDSGLKRQASALGAKALAGALLALYPRRHVRNLQREIYAYTVW
jgi:glycosyltransferase involved in cell wall biosynthesis